MLKLYNKQIVKTMQKHYLGKRWVFVCFLNEAIVTDLLTVTRSALARILKLAMRECPSKIA